jgi:NADH dehydrogenase
VSHHHVVIVGAGFGGLAAARHLVRSGQRVTLIDRRQYHLFTPLLYQVATGRLAPGEIAIPIRSVFNDQDPIRILMAEVTSVDLKGGTVTLDEGESLAFDFLVLAAGAQSHYFGHEEWSEHLHTLDDLESALQLKDHWLSLFERAAREADPARRRELLTVSIVGAGPSGVELAGAMAATSRRTLLPEYQGLGPADVRILLFEAEKRVLPGFHPRLSASVERYLEKLGVEVRTETPVDTILQGTVVCGEETIPSGMICWGAGVRPADVSRNVDAPREKDGLCVDDACAVVGHPRVFVVGDMSHFEDGASPLPGVAPVALQQGRHVARTILGDLRGLPRQGFRYRDKGRLATMGPGFAVFQKGSVHLGGRVAWLLWVALHIWYLVGFRTKVFVLLEWAWSYLGQRPGNRILSAENSPS